MSKDFTKLAEEVATKAHLGQFRNDGRTPYITHCRTVASIVENMLDKNNHFNSPYRDEMIQVAWLHDVIEDTNITEQDLRNYGFYETVIQGVLAITKNPDKTKEDYLSYLKRVKDNNLALNVKLADLEHNMSDLKHGNMRDKYTLAVWFLTH